MSASHFNQNQAFFLILDSYTLSEHRTTKLLPRLKGIVDVISSAPPPAIHLSFKPDQGLMRNLSENWQFSGVVSLYKGQLWINDGDVLRILILFKRDKRR